MLPTAGGDLQSALFFFFFFFFFSFVIGTSGADALLCEPGAEFRVYVDGRWTSGNYSLITCVMPTLSARPRRVRGARGRWRRHREPVTLRCERANAAAHSAQQLHNSLHNTVLPIRVEG